jgi:hypothetical protein
VSSRLVEHWRYRGYDWITSIDTLDNDLVIIGSRSGTLWILNRYGAELLREDVGSWIGALRIVDLRGAQWPEHLRGVYLLFGTKSGAIECRHIAWSPPRNVRLEERFSIQAANTIRDIDYRTSSDPAEINVAIGSEDKHVYLLNLLAALDRGADNAVKKIYVNGWIRSVTFVRDSAEQRWIVAAGCGDKNIYFLSLDGSEVARLFVDAKVHSLISDDETSKTYASSDARDIFVVGWTGSSLRVLSRTPLPHRATKLTFLQNNGSSGLIAAVCDDGTIYLYDPIRRELVGFLAMGERIYAIKPVVWNRTRLLLLGSGHGKLSANMYSIIEENISSTVSTLVDKLTGDAKEASSIADLSVAYLFGAKERLGQVGIGRFIDLVEAYPNAPRWAVVGCDGGDVCIIDMSDNGFGTIVLQNRLHRPARVWSVYGHWLSEKVMRLYVATSDKEVRVHEVTVGSEGVSVVEDRAKAIKLPDWPREIRPVAGRDASLKESILIVCESGDVVVTGDDPISFNNGQVMRSGSAIKVADGYKILTGSDNNKISMFHNEVHQWSVDTLDRVRETIIMNDLCLAVSEDRFLYVLDLQGNLRWRYRFPHRALCVDIVARNANRAFLVGCGDGNVYLLTECGYILESYEFPDRIRDVRVCDSARFVVACEDGWLYVGQFRDSVLAPGPMGDFYLLLDQFVQELRLKIARDQGFLEIVGLKPEIKLLLLEYLEYWLEAGDSELIFSLIDSVHDYVGAASSPLACYIYAKCLLVTATRVNFSAGRSRLEAYLADFHDNVYAVHSVVASITHIDLTRRLVVDRVDSPFTLIDSVIANLPLEDEWILEELVRSLDRAGFFGLGSDGFIKYLNTIHAPFWKLTKVIEKARVVLNPPAGLVRLLDIFSRDIRDRNEFHLFYDSISRGSAEIVVTCADRFFACAWPVDSARVSYERTVTWALGQLSPIVGNLLHAILSQTDMSEAQLTEREFRILALLIENEFAHALVESSSSDYLVVETFVFSLHALSRAGSAP